MAVQVQVKGPHNSVDFSLFGHDAHVERIHLDEEVLFITDIDNIPLYMVPLSKVRLIVPIANPQQEIPRSFGRDAAIKVHIAGDSEGDFEQVCNRIDYTKRFNTMMAELRNVTIKEGEPPQADLLLALPFENIRYVDFNHFIGTNDSPQKGAEEKASSSQPVKPKGQKPRVRPNIKNKARK